MANYEGNKIKRCWLSDFLKKVGPKTETGCREWKGPKHPYGSFCAWGLVFRAHRFSYALSVGRPVSEPEAILHSCDNPACVAWSHISAGTRDENNKDRARKGRSCKGLAHPKSKIDPADYPKIREMYASGMKTYRIGKIFGVKHPSIKRIIQNG